MTKTNSNKKIRLGQFYTRKSPFTSKVFACWIKDAINASGFKVIEPFAGGKDLAKLAKSECPKLKFHCYDIEPKARGIIKRDTISSFPKGFKIAITNPPFLAKNSAKRKRIFFHQSKHDDLYKECLERMLENVDYVAAIVPMSFIKSGFPKKRLKFFDELCGQMFDDTMTPVGLAMFVPEHVATTQIYRNGAHIGDLASIESAKKKVLGVPNREVLVEFNNKHGNIGLKAVDNTKCNSIEFVSPNKISQADVKFSSRHLTLIKVDYDPTPDDLNRLLERIRTETKDVLMTAFKGTRSDGEFRRRLDFAFAREILTACAPRE